MARSWKTANGERSSKRECRFSPAALSALLASRSNSWWQEGARRFTRLGLPRGCPRPENCRWNKGIAEPLFLVNAFLFGTKLLHYSPCHGSIQFLKQRRPSADACASFALRREFLRPSLLGVLGWIAEHWGRTNMAACRCPSTSFFARTNNFASARSGLLLEWVPSVRTGISRRIVFRVQASVSFLARCGKVI